MAYDNGQLTTYTFNIDFGASQNVVEVLQCPLSGTDTTTPGVSVRGLVTGATVFNLSEVFAGTSTNAGIRIGDGSDVDLYFDSGLVLTATNPAVLDSAYLMHDGASGTTRREIPAGLATPEIVCTFVAFTGSPTGQAHVSLHIWWELPKKL